MSAILAETALHSLAAASWGYFSALGFISCLAEKRYTTATDVGYISVVGVAAATFKIAMAVGSQDIPEWKKTVYVITPPLMWSCGIALAVFHLFKGGTLSSLSNN